MTYDATHLHSCQPVSSDLRIMVADGTILPITSRGLLHTSHFHVPDVAYIPQLSMNLIFASQLTSHGCLVIFYEFACRVQDRLTGTLLGVGCRRSGYMCLIVSAFQLLLHLRFRLLLPHFVFPRWASRSGITTSVISVVRV